MNGSHLPAGQPMPGGIGSGPGGRGPVELSTGNGPRRRQPPQYASHQHQHYHPQHINYANYYNSQMNPYANSYYPQVPPHYQNGVMPGAPYMQYNGYAARSPPVMHQQYPPIVSSSMQQPPQAQPYSRPPQQASPAVSTPPPYQSIAPPPPVPIPHTPSSTQSSQVAPASITPPTPQTQDVAEPQPEVEVLTARIPFKAPLPWLSRPDLPFPSRPARLRRKRRILPTETRGVELPSSQQLVADASTQGLSQATPTGGALPETPTLKSSATTQPSGVSRTVMEQPEMPSAQGLHSEDVRAGSPATLASVQTQQTSNTTTSGSTKTAKPAARAAIPTVPVVPVLPKTTTKEVKAPSTVGESVTEHTQEATQKNIDNSVDGQAIQSETAAADIQTDSIPVPIRVAPKLWTGLFTNTSPAASAASASGSVKPNGISTVDGTQAGNGAALIGSFAKANASSVAEALQAYRVAAPQKIAFLEPRGLMNTGNMCYMNSVLQVLIFCIPFYDFLDQVSKKAAHSFKSETPLIDAMIMFMREFKIIDSAVSVDKLRMRLKSEELEQYGEPFTPEFVYEAIKLLPRFASMRRGHQQDAEEFLGFLLEGLHDECTLVMRHLSESASSTAASSSAATPLAVSPTSTAESSDWMEVGRRQRPAVTRSSGNTSASSPITKIFGGQLRSELKVSGMQDSITLEPYQPLQLDIGSSQVRNIVDALRNLTRPEVLHGDFGSKRANATATKQVFIESLPPVLILHLKRFQFDAEGTGTIKIWKKIGYPLELEIPKEVFSKARRNQINAEGAGLPRYKLIAAVYHHGKNASGGHYTVDVRRQDDREWIRLDDTVIRRVRSEDVAEGGAEEDPKKLAAESENKKDGIVGGSGNRFESIADDESVDGEGWKKVSPTAGGPKKWSSVVNGTANNAAANSKGKQIKDNIKDNKVAYLLFYQRV